MKLLFHSLILHLLLGVCTLPHTAGYDEQFLTLGNTTDSGGTGITIPLDDSRVNWQAWSKWRCNCPAGSMSRVRDVKYQVAGVTLSNDDFNRKRFQRVVCDYNMCHCNRNLHQCDHAKADCSDREDYECAIIDVGYAEQQRTKNLWHTTKTRTYSMWDRLKNGFLGKRKKEEEDQETEEEPVSNRRQAAAKGKAKTRRKVTKKNKKSTGRR